MPNIVAKTMALVVAALLVIVLAVLYFTSRPPAGAQQVVAEFQNAFPLLEGMHVRVDGAIAGSVGTIEISDEGLAQVTLIMNDQIEDPRSDATAAIRQQDTTGDSYVAFEPGKADEPLPEEDGKPTIACEADGPTEPCRNSLVAPRFDDLLNAFGPAERAGVKLLLGELSRALEGRGEGLNRAALDLRPALLAANRALAEVNRQNAALRPLIEDAEAVTGQAASRRAELAGLVDSLDATLKTTASVPQSLDAGLERLPATVDRARTTLAALTRAATAGQPLARELASGAAGLADALRKAPGFLDDTSAVIERTTPTLELTRKLLRAGTPTIVSDPQRVVTGAFDLAPAISNLLTGTLGDESTIKALFGDDSGGVGEGTLDNFGLGAVTVEPGNQLGYPASHANRNFFRISAVLNCTMFGVEIRPGCLGDVLAEARGAEAASLRGGAQRRDTGGRDEGDTPPEGSSRDEPGLSDLPLPLPDVKLPDLGLGELLDPGQLGDRVKDLGDALGARRGSRPRPGPALDDHAVDDLLDFLLR